MMKFRHVTQAALLSLAASGAFGYGGDSGRSAAALGSPDRSYTVGVADISSGRYADGIQSLEAYTAQVTDNADAENWLGYAYRKTGDLDEAFAHYDRALTLNPRHRGAHEYLGEAYLMAGNLSKAQEHLKILQGLCGSCEEYTMLHRSIDEYMHRNGIATTSMN